MCFVNIQQFFPNYIPFKSSLPAGRRCPWVQAGKLVPYPTLSLPTLSLWIFDWIFDGEPKKKGHVKTSPLFKKSKDCFSSRQISRAIQLPLGFFD